MLSPRLLAVLDLVEGRVLADIGTDHAYLPIEACRAGKCETAIASDINAGPLKIADFNIREAGFIEKVETRLGDGLQSIASGEADCIVITGMGGMRIMGILNDDKIKNARLILQPQHDLEALRRHLHAHHYDILCEKLVREADRFYVIICAKKADTIIPWSDKKYFLGNADSKHWHDYLQQRRGKIERYIHSIHNAAPKQEAEKQLQWLKEALETCVL
ncbi:MAG: class I SAM-dependent methyltransferase [Defluviitaleaceae bacterium]|nr:class I SAM-dependent methyltransferase [Defluviitaleaceae bacterium]